MIVKAEKDRQDKPSSAGHPKTSDLITPASDPHAKSQIRLSHRGMQFKKTSDMDRRMAA